MGNAVDAMGDALVRGAGLHDLYRLHPSVLGLASAWIGYAGLPVLSSMLGLVASVRAVECAVVDGPVGLKYKVSGVPDAVDAVVGFSYAFVKVAGWVQHKEPVEPPAVCSGDGLP